MEATTKALAHNRELLNDPAVHETLLAWVKQYLLVGGMPEVVAEYQESRNYARCRQIQTSLLQTYRDDFNKYARHNRHENIGRGVPVWRKTGWEQVQICQSRSWRTVEKYEKRIGIIGVSRRVP